MKISIVSLGALALSAALIAGGALARAEDAPQSGQETAQQTQQYAKRLFGKPVAPKGKSFACFARRYDAAHLAQHPAQTVTAMRLLVSAEVIPDDSSLSYGFILGLKFRDRAGKFSSSGSCSHPTAQQESPDKLILGCGVDCDGGGLSLALASTDKTMLVGIDSIAIWDDGKPDDERTSLQGGTDDRLFRLERVPLEQCRPLMKGNDQDQPATM